MHNTSVPTVLYGFFFKLFRTTVGYLFIWGVHEFDDRPIVRKHAKYCSYGFAWIFATNAQIIVMCSGPFGVFMNEGPLGPFLEIRKTEKSFGLAWIFATNAQIIDK